MPQNTNKKKHKNSQKITLVKVQSSSKKKKSKSMRGRKANTKKQPVVYSPNSIPNINRMYQILPSDTSTTDTKKILEKYSEYYSMNDNTIHNDSALMFAFTRFDSLKNGQLNKVTILHLGDSHIQADYFSSWIRTEVQKYFGSRGYGLFYPYTLSHTPSPRCLFSFSNCTWDSYRNLGLEKELHSGVSGYSVTSYDNNRLIGIGVLPFNTLSNYFNQITIFHSENNCELSIKAKEPLNYQQNINLEKLDSAELNDGLIVSSQKAKYNGWSLSRFSLTKPTNYFVLKIKSAEDEKFSLYGGILEDINTRGVLYQTAGVGGSQLSFFTRATLFNEQLEYLKPDMVIVTLGTNEAVSRSYDTLWYETKVRSFVQTIKRINPKAGIIFMLPPDFLYHRKYPNYLKTISRIIQRVCISENAAYWDWNTIMGGKGSMKQWTKAKLGMGDYIHFSPIGYRILGELFSKAFFDSYFKYRK